VKRAMVFAGFIMLVGLLLLVGCAEPGHREASSYDAIADSFESFGGAIVDGLERDLERQRRENEARAAQDRLQANLAWLRVGMTKAQVRQLCGSPKPGDITCREYAHSSHEAWFYGDIRRGRVMVWFHESPQVTPNGVVIGEQVTVESIHRH